MKRTTRLLPLVAALLLWCNASSVFAANSRYTYDDLNRLIKVEYGDGSVVEYGYDAVGNRLILSVTPSNGSLSVTIGPLGAITAGAHWRVDGGVWQSSGATVPGCLPAYTPSASAPFPAISPPWN
jgi:YD repeat-containing protein